MVVNLNNIRLSWSEQPQKVLGNGRLEPEIINEVCLFSLQEKLSLNSKLWNLGQQQEHHFSL